MNSLRKGKCLSQSCRYRHIKGTTRHETDGKANVSTHPQTKSQPALATGNENAQKQAANTSSFLDAIRLLKAEILEEMDKRINAIAQAKVQPHPTMFLQQIPQATQMPPQMLQMLQQPHQQPQQPLIKQPSELSNTQSSIPQLFYPQPTMILNQKTQQQQYHQQPPSLPIPQTQHQIAQQPINQSI